MKALKEAIELNIPCVIECDICKDDKVFPMVAPGAPISEAFDRDDLNKRRVLIKHQPFGIKKVQQILYYDKILT